MPLAQVPSGSISALLSGKRRVPEAPPGGGGGGGGSAVWLGTALSGDSNLYFTPQAISLFSIFPQLLPQILKYLI